MTDNLELHMDAYLPLRDVVFQTLRTAILTGDLKPGERLMELQLAAKLGVSRTPIREAIRMLEQEGLAITIPRRGAEVAKMTEKAMEDVLQIREALEELAIKLTIQKITPEQLEGLKEAEEGFKAAIETGDVVAIAKADVHFHDILNRAGDNPKLIALLNNLREQMYRYRVEYLKNESIYSRLIKEHGEIYQSVCEKDQEKAITCLHTHLGNQAEAVKQMIREQE